MKVTFKEHRLNIAGKEIEMAAPIDQILSVGDKILVLMISSKERRLTHLTRPHANSNVVCFDKEGNWLWEIEHREPTYEERPSGGYNPFQELEEIPGRTDKFKAWGGDFWVIVDINTGKWLEYKFTK